MKKKQIPVDPEVFKQIIFEAAVEKATPEQLMNIIDHYEICPVWRKFDKKFVPNHAWLMVKYEREPVYAHRITDGWKTDNGSVILDSRVEKIAKAVLPREPLKIQKEKVNFSTAMDFAKYVIATCKKEYTPVSNLKLQSILYCIQRDHLQKYGKPAFPDEFEAWDIGPIIPEIYYRFCGYGGMPISHIYEDYVGIYTRDPVMDMVNFIIKETSRLEPWDIASEVRCAGGAWEQVYRKGEHLLIPKDLIQKCG